MNILITGADGFIGSRMSEKLKKDGNYVIEHCFTDGDVSKKGGLNQYNDLGVEIVYHFAAKTFVPDSWNNVYDYFNVNIMGTVSVLEFCRENHCPAVLMSTYVYGEPEFLPISEEHPVSAITPYHETKLILEHIGKFYSEKFSIPVVIFRPFNVYGMGQSENFLLPKIMKQLVDENISEIKVMDIRPKRDYVYIDDVIEALLCALSVKEGCHVYNIGTGVSYSVEEVIKICGEVLGIKKPYCATEEVRNTEISDCKADISRLRKDFGYQVKYSLQEGIKSWYGEMQHREVESKQ